MPEVRLFRGLRPSQSVAAVLVALAALTALVGGLEGLWLESRSAPALEANRGARLRAAQERFELLARQLLSAAHEAAALPEAGAALRGDRGALPELFRALERMGSGPTAPAAAIHAVPFSKVAWARPTADIHGLDDLIPARSGLHILAGSVSTTLLATAPISERGGRLLGLATAEAPLRVERHISNRYLRDFDRVTGDDPGLEVEYFDVLSSADREPRPGTLLIRDQQGIALARVAADDQAGRPDPPLPATWRRAASTLLCAGLLVLVFAGQHLVGLTALVAGGWAALFLLGPPWPFPAGFSSRGLPGAPGEAVLSALLGALLAASVCRAVLARAPSRPGLLASALSALASLPLLGLAFALVGRIVTDSPYDLAAVSVFPRSAAHLALQVSLLLLLAAAFLLLVALLSYGGPLPEAPRALLLRGLVLSSLALLAVLLWPRDLVGLPLVPSLLFFLVAVLLAATHARWRAWLAASSAGPRAGLLLLGVAGLSLVLHPTLVHFGEKAQRWRIEGQYAQLIRGQSAWREERVRAAREAIDALAVLEEHAPGHPPVGLEELAFSIWSETRLNEAGLASAVEVQDRRGEVISRFSLDLPALLASLPPQALPKHDSWAVSREKLQVGSAERQVLHARRRLTYHGEVHGAVHVYVGADSWDLPFLPPRDPYSALFRSAPSRPDREEPLDLTVYAQPTGVLFSSAERPPTLSPGLIERLRRSPDGYWTTLPVDGRAHHTYLLTRGDAVYALSYPRLSPGGFAAGLAEAVAGLGGVAVLGVLAVMLVRTVLRETSLTFPSLLAAVRARFALRLFVAFVAAAVVPVGVLEAAFRGYVAERLRRESEEQALERAAVAQRAVDDFSSYQRGEGPDRAAVTNTALVWVARLIRGDVDVFGRGRLLASSKRELFSSGLLPSTVPGPVFRALILEGAPSVLRTETIGGFAALVAYVPVRLDGVEPGILALPLAVKEREVRATLEAFDRSMRLASLAFLALAAGLALSLSRRIAGPIRELTGATRRVAAGDLEARVATASRDELKELVDAFNQMAGDLDRQRRDLERSNRLAAWAEMARQVAHEVKNPLTPIQLSAEHLLRVWRDRAPDFGATLEACTGTILRQVRTLRGIVTEFSAFARPPAPEPEPADLGPLVEEALRPYRSSLPPGVSLALDVEPGLPRLRLDRRLVSRAVVNLLENALHAVGDRGRIAVRVLSSKQDGLVEVAVEDDGPGLTPEALARAFEPFFSTKGNGSGLGLALVRRVAEDHGGSALLTRDGGTTRARLCIPAPTIHEGGLTLPHESSE
jgi:signal transduction histidine kinase